MLRKEQREDQRRNTCAFFRSREAPSEVDTHVQIAERLGLASPHEALSDLIDRCFAKLTALMNALERQAAAEPL